MKLPSLLWDLLRGLRIAVCGGIVLTVFFVWPLACIEYPRFGAVSLLLILIFLLISVGRGE